MTLGCQPVFLCFGRISHCGIDLVPPDRQNLAACTLFLLQLHISASGLTSGRIVCVQALPLFPFLGSETFTQLPAKVHSHGKRVVVSMHVCWLIVFSDNILHVSRRAPLYPEEHLLSQRNICAQD